MAKEWVKISQTPSFFQHTWDDISDAVVTSIGRGSQIYIGSHAPCMCVFYGGKMTCPCGLVDLESL